MDQFTVPRRAHDAALSRATRAAFGWSLAKASRRAGVSVASVLAAEGRGAGPASSIAPDRLRRAYEEAVVLFVDHPAGCGIRMTVR